MVKIEHWYEKYPDLLKRERELLSNYGFTFKINNNVVEFIGNSRIMKDYPIRLIYPNGYPSFPPTVKCDVGDDLILVRHHNKITKSLCLFGFSSERWKANLSALDILNEIEELIYRFSPLNYNAEQNKDDIVPEPLVNQFDYKLGGILIPPPFGNWTLDEFKDVSNCEILYDPKTRRGIISKLKLTSDITKLDDSYKNFFDGYPIMKSTVFKLKKAPPLINENIIHWLKEENISIKDRKNQIVFFIFEDEWGKKGNKRIGWVALKILDGRATWMKCYSINLDDIYVRNPFGQQLNKKVVTLIGCGSLGSIVATTLAQEGISTLNLIDYDILEPANSIRHQVGQGWFGFSKVVALKHRILNLIPMAKVNDYGFSVGAGTSEENVRKLLQLIGDSDLIIDTSASHKVTHYINRLCVEEKKPLIIGSVTNGAWSCEVVRVIPMLSGCWGCWNKTYGGKMPPSAPPSEFQFAPGCDQPTFVGGISSINIAGGLVAKASIDTLLNINSSEDHYIEWSERDKIGDREYKIKYLPNPPLKDCEVCNGNY